MSRPAWTDERVTRLKALWGEGFSAKVVANDLGGLSRNAVLGKVHRLGLSKDPRRQEQTKREVRVQANRPRRIPKIAMALAVEPPLRRHTGIPECRRPLEFVPPLPPLNVPILDHQHGQCREVTGHDGLALFCGHPAIEGTSWCAHHHSVNFQRPARRLTESSADYFSGVRRQAAEAL
jgi:GcrA cell cycle regulator